MLSLYNSSSMFEETNPKFAGNKKCSVGFSVNFGQITCRQSNLSAEVFSLLVSVILLLLSSSLFSSLVILLIEFDWQEKHVCLLSLGHPSRSSSLADETCSTFIHSCQISTGIFLSDCLLCVCFSLASNRRTTSERQLECSSSSSSSVCRDEVLV